MNEGNVAPLADFGSGDVGLAGGKGAALGELVRQGFPVPPGFVITTDAYAGVLKDTGLDARLDALLPGPLLPGDLMLRAEAGIRADIPVDTTADGARIRALFGGMDMPKDLAAEIRNAYKALGGGAVAVRSSATAEDLPGATFAGQQDTFLFVHGEDAVVRAVQDCWASLWTDRAIAYRQRTGIDPRDVAIAVVVQIMVPAESAGVMFTANPVTGERDQIAVDASPGLGEAVVSGRVTPEHYVLDREGRMLSFKPGGGEVVVRPAPDGGTREHPGTPQTGPSLDTHQLAELAALARRAQEHFGRPQDMEWAVAGGRVSVLQSRPMTALPPQPPRLNRFQRAAGPVFVEMFQQRPYPLDASGWLARGIVPMLHRMAASVGIAFPALGELLLEEDGVVVQLVPASPRLTIRALKAPVSLARRGRKFKTSAWKQDPRFAAFLTRVERLNATDPGPLSWDGVVAMADNAIAAMRGITDLRVSYLPGIILPVLKLHMLLLLVGKTELGSSLVAGAETRTSQANRALEHLAEVAAADPVLARAFDESATARIFDALAEGKDHGEFREAFEAFLLEYGNRETVSVVLSSAPTWSEAPEVVLGIVKTMLGEPRQAVDQTGKALDELKRQPALRFAWLRRRVLAIVDSARAGMAFREDTHFYATKVLPPMRRAYAELGRRLVREGVIDDPHDVYHLRFDELASIHDTADGGLPGDLREKYRSLVLARAEKRRELEGIPLLDPALLFARRQPVSGALVSGAPASGGRAEGCVRIIRGPAEFGELRSGEVLVCPYTNPSWTPLFMRAAAVVVDAGGIGSHAAIVAREYGIPAVMGTGTGTSALAVGQYVIVDGSAGVVTASGGKPPVPA